MVDWPSSACMENDPWIEASVGRWREGGYVDMFESCCVFTLTYQLGFLRWEKQVDVVWIYDGREVLIAIGHGGTSCLELPSVYLESGSIGVGGDSSEFPGDVATIGARVDSEPVQGACAIGTLGVWRLESEAICNRWPSRLATEDPADNAHVEIV